MMSNVRNGKQNYVHHNVISEKWENEDDNADDENNRVSRRRNRLRES